MTKVSNDCRLTTFDNPYNPFTQFAEWLLFDNSKDYFTLNKLARIEQVDESMSENEINIEHERAIDEIIQNDFLNIYKKVYRNEEINEQIA
jgi:hypothetical protein